MVTIHLAGLELYGFHGAEEAERRNGQPFVFEVWLDVPETAFSDRLRDAVDYRLVAQCVREVSEGRAYHLLEALAGALVDELLTRFPASRVRVEVRKPQVVLDPAVDYASVVVERTR
jgi:dihydroneopterin aldolase